MQPCTGMPSLTAWVSEVYSVDFFFFKPCLKRFFVLSCFVSFCFAIISLFSSKCQIFSSDVHQRLEQGLCFDHELLFDH